MVMIESNCQFGNSAELLGNILVDELSLSPHIDNLKPTISKTIYFFVTAPEEFKFKLPVNCIFWNI